MPFAAGLRGLLLLAAAHAAPAADPYAEVDALYAQRYVDGAANGRAVGLLDAVLAAGDDYGALWRRARAERFSGERSPRGRRLEVFTRAKEFAERAARANPDGWEGHYWLGVALGRYGEEKGVMKSLGLIKPIRTEMERVLALRPEHGGAHHVLGVLYRKAPGLISIGDDRRSLAHAARAAELEPDNVTFHMGHAASLLANGRKAEAKVALERVLSLPGRPGEEEVAREEHARAKEMLARLG